MMIISKKEKREWELKNKMEWLEDEILVKFKFRVDLIRYTTAILELLISDEQVEYIINANTGELIFNR